MQYCRAHSALKMELYINATKIVCAKASGFHLKMSTAKINLKFFLLHSEGPFGPGAILRLKKKIYVESEVLFIGF